MITLDWNWVTKAPLSAAWRRRLEICAGVVASAAAVVVLSTAMKPSPEWVAAMHGRQTLGMSEYAASEGPSFMTAAYTPPQEFIVALEHGDIAGLNKAYVPGMNIERMLRVAASYGKKESVMWMLAHGAKIHEDENTPSSPLLAADAFPDVTALLRARGMADAPLEACAEANAPNAFLRVFEKPHSKADLDASLLAISQTTTGTDNGKRIIFDKLLEAGADPNAHAGVTSVLGGAITDCDPRTGTGQMAIHCLSTVSMLLDRGARVTGDALAAGLSLDEQHHEAFDMIIDRPMDAGVIADGLARASSVSARDVAKLKTLKIDWAWHDGEDDAALPVMAAVRRADRDGLAILLDAGAPVDMHYKDGSCALTDAIDNAVNNPEAARIVELLVKRGANVNRRLPDGRTPLFAAAEAGDIRVVNFLLDHGARPNDRVLQDTALDAAQQHDNIAAARIIDAHGGVSAHPY